MRRGVFRTQSQIPSRTLGTSGGYQGTAVCSLWPPLGSLKWTLEKFFDRVNHDELMVAVARRVRANPTGKEQDKRIGLIPTYQPEPARLKVGSKLVAFSAHWAGFADSADS